MIQTTTSVCYYPGAFAPPTKQHYRAAIWLESRREVSQVIVVLGNDMSDQVSIDKKEDMWDIYLKSLPNNISVVRKDKNSAIKGLYDIISKDPHQSCYIALDKENARDKTFLEIFDKFPNYKIQLLPSQFEDESQKMLEAANSKNYMKFEQYLPEMLPEESMKLCYDIMTAQEMDEAISGAFNKFKF